MKRQRGNETRNTIKRVGRTLEPEQNLASNEVRDYRINLKESKGRQVLPHIGLVVGSPAAHSRGARRPYPILEGYDRASTKGTQRYAYKVEQQMCNESHTERPM